MIAKPVISPREAAARVKEGMTLQVGGFLGCGSPATLIDALVGLGTCGLTLVSSDTGILGQKGENAAGSAPLIASGQAVKVYSSHIGLNAETQRRMREGSLEVVLVPQGTLAERVRAAGAGLGGVLTPTGLGTEAAEGKEKVRVGDRVFLLELPLPGDVAFIKAKRADRAGNLQYAKTARNFNPLMATACALVVAEVEELVEIGEIDPDQVHTPSIFVDFLVMSEARR
jgi:acetate CoA/acetoacetate CoA-transferase alpha subunit